MYGYTISYVGSDEPLNTIEEGSLIRLSLAHWWKPEDSDDEERCYLQLSGCLIQGKGEGMQKMQDTTLIEQPKDWFDGYEQELDRLLTEKADIEEKILDLRSKIQQQMEERHLEKYATAKYSVNYSPAKTILHFDRKTFKEENEELYSSYCIPKQKDATIVIRKNRSDSKDADI